jgi:hypothetical protein
MTTATVRRLPDSNQLNLVSNATAAASDVRAV